ncbi:MAG TPA: TIR domain-containing protein [Casimicrobiaceae bacterium]|nr:TIR domain-containing protein [Casimicrobiaceae bacterium]
MNRAVFLSYSSQDADAARRIAEALRAVGIEVWFDQSELVGGDAWDQKIRQQIRECALFVPIISATTQSRREAYFRLEWKLADERTHLMAKGTPFILPVAIDETKDRDALVPDSFLAVQWTKLPGGETPAAFCGRVQRLLGGDAPTGGPAPDKPTPLPARTPTRWLVPAVVGAILVAVLSGVAVWRPWQQSARSGETAPPSTSAATRELIAQAKALLGDPMRVKENYLAVEDLGARAVALDPQDASAWTIYAEAAIGLISSYNDQSEQQRANARSRVERAIRLAPDSLDAALAMANFELSQEDDRGTPALEQRLRSLLVTFPSDKRVLRALGDSLERQGKFDEAIAAYDRSNGLPGGDAAALAKKAWALRDARRAEDGVEAAAASIALQPNTEAYGAKLILLYGLGDLERTRAVIETLPPAQLREDRVAFVAYNMWMQLRQPDKAAEALRRLDHDFIREGRIAMPTRLGLGEAQRAAGRANAAAIEYESALATVNQRLQAEPTSADLASWKALLLARLGRKAEAAQWFQTTLELRGVKPDDLAKIGPRTLIALGRPDDAIAGMELRFRAGGRAARMPYLHTDPDLDPLRDMPRFKALVKAYDERKLQAPQDDTATATKAAARPR